MDTLTLLHTLLLGLVEGVTEFLPVSSTGHLILLIDILGFEAPPGKVFEVVIQLGAIAAICWLYRVKLWQVTCGLPTDASARKFVLLLVVAFIPAGIVGATAHGYIKSVLFSPLVVSAMLVVGGVAILLIEKYKPAAKTHEVESLSYRQALLVGCFQALAVIPGTSRSGATIMGGLLLGLDRKLAAEFSFFLAIPTMLGATVYDVYKNADMMTTDAMQVIAIGFVTAFVAALLSIRLLMAIISTHGFAPFAIYRIVLGSVMLWMLLA